MQRIAAHYIIYDGVTYPDSVIELDDDGRISIFPFEGELHSTVFMPGRVVIELDTNRARLIAKRID